ncbi:CRISPR-associated protein Cas2 [Ligilactobacillus sp. WC1T17]|uniref:CRISPR-associated protein Cas2 n=1 Tax=Ligilactobacillus ruminis TaxID=1623 RepID=A0ABY1AA27_9LACO|nr:CRISPR-associated protein Cas2 [Ligilactobacillus ruminis]
MIVITLSKVPSSLRGDLTKWCQEIQTGVYVGNFSARIRGQLWTRIIKNIGSGEATMVYNTNNELGYTFLTTNVNKRVVDYDGIPLMMRVASENKLVKHGFSNAAKFHRAKKAQEYRTISSAKSPISVDTDIVSIDIETTGLDYNDDNIISIGAKKQSGQEFSRYIVLPNSSIPINIVKMTGITDNTLQEKGVDIKEALVNLKKFLGDSTIVGYNLTFDMNFLQIACKKSGQDEITNHTIDLVPLVKKDDEFLDNYRLETVLREYGIKNENPHHALSDAKATLELAIQLVKNGRLKF